MDGIPLLAWMDTHPPARFRLEQPQSVERSGPSR
jgi:hypothetical protein